MLKLKIIGPNQTVISTEKIEVFFSYETPVAAFVQGQGYVRTDTFYSTTTSKHINGWLRGTKAETVPQEEIDNLLEFEEGRSSHE